MRKRSKWPNAFWFGTKATPRWRQYSDNASISAPEYAPESCHTTLQKVIIERFNLFVCVRTLLCPDTNLCSEYCAKFETNESLASFSKEKRYLEGVLHVQLKLVVAQNLKQIHQLKQRIQLGHLFF
jgi:hypothetical protein